MSFLRRIKLLLHSGRSSTSSSGPIYVLAAVVGFASIGITFGSLVLDRARAQQQAAVMVKGAADIARQRVADLFARVETTLRAVEDVAAPAPLSEAARNRIDEAVNERRRAEPRLLALYLVDSSGAVLAGSASAATRGNTIVPACLLDGQPDPDQVLIHGVSVAQPGGGTLRGLCVAHGFRRDTVAGTALTVIATDLLGGQFTDLSVGGHGAVILLDEGAHPLALVTAGQIVTVNPAAPPAPLPNWDAVVRAGGLDPDTGAVTETRRVDGPFGAVVALSIPPEDVLASWEARAMLVISSTSIVLFFIALAVLAVRSSERRERDRLERIATLTLDMHSWFDHAAMTLRVAEEACTLTGCDLLPAGTAEEARVAEHSRAPELTLPRATSVRLGPHVLRTTNGAGLTAADLTILTILSRINAIQLDTSGRLADIEAAMQEMNAISEEHRLAAVNLLLEMPDAMLTLDTEWRIVSTNRNADRLFGEYAEDVRGSSIWDVFPELAGTIFETESRRAVAGRHACDFEMRWLRTETWLMVTVHPRPTGIAIYLQDISRQVAADDKLHEAAKMEAIGRLTGRIAHDFNNLLTVILGNIEMLDLELPENGEVREMHEQIRKAAQSAAERTHQMLAFARRQPLSPSDVDVSRLVTGLEALLRRTLGAVGTIEIRCPPSLWRVRVDPTQLEHAIVKIAENARDAIPAGRGGLILIEGANITLRKVESDLFGELRPGNYVVISVSDNGTGITRDVLSKVFEPFFTTKISGRGIGLGLAMVYGFITQSGGHVRVVSDEGRGATVRLYLPALVEQRGEAIATPAHHMPPAVPVAGQIAESAVAMAGECILVVEDSDMVRGYTRNVLTGLGYEVISVSEGSEALARIEEGLRPDLLLTDVLLPNGMDGIEVAAQALRLLPGLPVVYMSGYVENIDINKLKLDPKVNLLLKPFRRAALARMVRSRLDGQAEDSRK